MEQKNLIIILAVIIVLVLGALGIYIGAPDLFKSLIPTATKKIEKQQPKVIEETLVIPETEKITGTEGRTIEEGNVDVPLVPKDEGEKVIVSKAVLTVKGAYNLALVEAQKWSADARLVLIKSLGAVTLDGKSSQWQLAFSSASAKATADKSKTTQKGYEVIIQADQIVSKKEIDSTVVGADVPKNWYDSDGAIKSLQDLPQFFDATLSSINFYYNTDSKSWEYALATSKGATSMSVQ